MRFCVDPILFFCIFCILPLLFPCFFRIFLKISIDNTLKMCYNNMSYYTRTREEGRKMQCRSKTYIPALGARTVIF